MLILARKTGQSIVIADNIEITVLEIRGDQVRLGIVAPRSVQVYRKELLDQVRAENIEASTMDKEGLERLAGKNGRLPEAKPQDEDVPNADHSADHKV